jgi:hypothetical protein
MLYVSANTCSLQLVMQTSAAVELAAFASSCRLPSVAIVGALWMTACTAAVGGLCQRQEAASSDAML